MTDLEELWDDLPARAVPTERILAAGRRAEMAGDAVVAAADDAVRRAGRRPLWARPVVTAGVVTAVAASFLVGSTLHGGSGSSGLGPGGGDLPSNAAFQADLKPAKSCDQLLQSYIERGLDRVTAWGWTSPYQVYARAYDGLDAQLMKAPVAAAGSLDTATRQLSGDLPATHRANSSATGTNVQEAGVDEPDVVKTDGKLLVRVHDDELWLYDVSGSSVDRLSTIALDGIDSPEILLAGGTVVAIGQDERAPVDTAYDTVRRGTRVQTIDVSDPTKPSVTGDVAYDTELLSARQHGDAIRLVLSSGLPDLPFKHPHRGLGRRAAAETNRKLVRDTTIEDWLPTIADDTATGKDADPQQLLDCTDVAIPDDEVGLDTVSVVGFDATDPTAVDAIGLAGATDISYESTDHLYLAATPVASECFDLCPLVGRIYGPGYGVGAPTDGTTYLFQFDLDGTRATHVASGEVEGRIDDRWSMDEADGVLRVAVSPTQQTGDFSSIVTFHRSGQQLLEIGRLDHLGGHQDLKAVRWFDDLAVLETFHRIDPLYAVDLTHVRHPKRIGYLKIAGFSDYLHPLGTKRMIGVGQGPDGHGRWGAQIGLFDVHDLTRPRRIDVTTFGGGTEALAGQDPRSFTWVPQSRTVLTTIQRWGRARVGYLAVLQLHHGEIRRRLTQVEYGDDVALVRAVPLGDGRVVLVTGEDVRFLNLENR